MNDPEGFLSRWSRRKREAGEDAPRRSAAAPPEETARAKREEVSARESEAPSSASPMKAEPAFDLSKLPPIESITATTDIRPFLAPGVPAALTRAALRRAWVTDPKIRDYVGLSENSWDFNAPGVAGFDHSAPTGDIKRMLAEIFGDKPANESAPDVSNAGSHASRADEAGVTKSSVVEPRAHRIVNEPERDDRETKSNEQGDFAQRTSIAEDKHEDAATQQDDATQNMNHRSAKRIHGSAMPR